MIPIRDTIPSSRVPVVNYALIAVNVAAFLYQVALGEELFPFVQKYAVVPARFVVDVFQSTREMLTPVTAMFLHGGWMHMLGNMLYLYIFGDNVEDTLGHGGYLLFYLACGLVSFGVQILFQPASAVPNLGASGAIAGVLGAYFLLFPRARVVTLLPLFVIFTVVEIPAVVFLGLWFLLQFLSGAASLGRATLSGGVAWWAHVGGFVAGMVFLKTFIGRGGKGRAATV
ncbi:MAG: rhomboid family intramembrane serine protease [Deltaproteobacteria bacterium]|nr:MAG: rhomboid family intramembrane serine protease [Deltaproteobacteria bacterium]